MSAVSRSSPVYALLVLCMSAAAKLMLAHHHAEWGEGFGSRVAGWLLTVGSSAATSLGETLELVVEHVVVRLGLRSLGLDTTGSVSESPIF